MNTTIVKLIISRELPMICVSSQVEEKMKAQNFRFLLRYSILFQILLTVPKIKADGGNKYVNHARLREAVKNTINEPPLKVYLRIDLRENASIIKFELPPKSNDIDFLKKILDPEKKLVFLVHGFLSNSTDKWLGQLSAAYLKREDVVVFIPDWGTGSITLEYPNAALNTHPVAEQLINFTKVLINQLGSKAFNIHIIGHDLGAHIAGFIGKGVSGIKRITGLDPSNKLFPENSPMLSKEDAEQVDVLHTSKQWGTLECLGHVDFYINGGENQPGCKPEKSIRDFFYSFVKDSCSHSRAHAYFIESIDNPNNFVARKKIEQAQKARSFDFDTEQDTVMGLDTFKYKSRGEFFITADAPSP